MDDLARLLRRHEQAARGWAGTEAGAVEVELAGRGAEPREHLAVADADGALRAWATVHDRAAGRVLVAVVVDPELDDDTADRLARDLLAWCEAQGRRIAGGRGLGQTQLDSGAFADDPRQQRWLTGAGYHQARTWWQMSRPVVAEEAGTGAFPAPKPGVSVRRIALEADGLPSQDDLRTVHDVLESSFADHFNSHQETFDEFLSRLREGPGHRWDHWWVAEIAEGEADADHRADADHHAEADHRAAGAVVSSVIPPALTSSGAPQPAGSYIDYIGVLSTARGRGVAKALLRAVIVDAALRGRDRVALEVDADSPTGADRLYSSMGWTTSYITQSWHKDLEASR